MKVSKVDHFRVGSGVTEKETKGIMYRDPAQKGSTVADVRDRICKLNEKAQRLYKPFNSHRESTDAKDGTNIIRDKAQRVIMDAVKNGKNRPVKADTAREMLMNAAGHDVHIEKTPEEIKSISEKIAVLSLRRSLQRPCKGYNAGTDMTELMSKLVYSVALLPDASALRSFDDADLECMFNTICSDYYKDELSAALAKSIEDKDVRVQVADIDGVKKLVLSNYDRKNKKYIFEFVKNFAGTDADGRNSMLARMRKLEMLFFFGRDMYNDIKEADKKSLNSYLPGPEIQFCPDAELKLQDYVQMSGTDRKKAESALRKMIENSILDHYMDAKKTVGDDDEAMFWVSYFEKFARKELLEISKLNSIRLGSTHLCNRGWHEWMSFMVMKYIDMGKATYHFAMPDIYNVGQVSSANMGRIRDEFINGLTSFDYERLKADETLDRNLSVAITFAGNTFSSAAFKNEYRLEEQMNMQNKKTDASDPLFYDDRMLNDGRRPDSSKRILRYFGGESRWADAEVSLVLEEDDGANKFAKIIRDCISNVRNVSYHFTDSESKTADSDDVEIVRSMLEFEADNAGILFRKKMYSNNVPAFYATEDINRVMEKLYDGQNFRPAQIPSFEKIIKRKNLTEFMNSYAGAAWYTKITDADTLNKLRSAVYFVLKEAYYRCFICEPKISGYFKKALDNMEKSDLKNKKAYENFRSRINEICGNGDRSFGEICQTIMTDYNMQNQGRKDKLSQKEQDKQRKNGTDESYQHFKLLLYSAIAGSFRLYLEENADLYGFLKNPVKKSVVSEEEFCGEWKCSEYSSLVMMADENDDILSWYVTSHFLPPKKINELQGDIRSYIQYVTDVSRRAVETGNRVPAIPETKINYYKQVLDVLDLVIMFSGQTSNVMTDYFEDEDTYARYLFNFVQFANKKEPVDKNSLVRFCSSSVNGDYDIIKYREKQDESLWNEAKSSPKKQKVPAGIKYGIYCDEAGNPILNRNVVLASMFGSAGIIAGHMDRVGDMKIQKFYKLKFGLQEVFKNGKCKSETEQEKLREFQNLKNYIELADVGILTELVNDLLSQLVVWCYMRERDLMFMQLGYYYVRLFHTDAVPEDNGLRKIKGNDADIADGAILYQLVSLNTFDLGLFYGDGKRAAKSGNYGLKFKLICKYFDQVKDENQDIYSDGLELFEDISKHDEMVKLRNYIDHMKYVIQKDRSILDIFSSIYNGFLDYDIKLKKSISYVLTNILMHYAIDAKLKFRKGEGPKPSADIIIDTAVSDNYTFKNLKLDKDQDKSKGLFSGKKRKTEGDINLSRRSDEFIKWVKAILSNVPKESDIL